MRVGFIGLGNVGAKLAGTLARNGVDLAVHDLDPGAMAPLLAAGARAGGSPAQMARDCDIVITCLPSPAASAAAVEGPDGLLQGIGPGKIWVEMSTTDEAVMQQLATRIAEVGAEVADCPVSGGCHRAATGNIAIFAGCDRPVFDRLLPVLTILGRQVLHTGPLGSASVLKVMTNYLATLHLVGLTEAFTVMKAAGIDPGLTYEAIRISSGNSFVHETESRMILSGSRDIGFTMDLVNKDIGLFQTLAEDLRVPLELSPLLCYIFAEAEARMGPRAQSDRIIERLEEATGLSILAPGFDPVLVDDEPEGRGHEVRPAG
ncbi:MAG: 3-hydroxyisobutyrate dehydrogenase [Rhodobacteraceae bacterium HLUCCA08]|nr:MAG: 3-hydroxyisobutyrate dehydrogenase [Rhodobacteraceae bacterium HLUCCA08]